MFCLTAANAIQPRLMGTEASVLWIALLPLLLVLWQSGAYWLLARSWVAGGSMPDAVAAVYRVFRVLDALVLAGSLVAIILWLPSRIPVLVLVIAVWLFALVE